MITYSFDRDRVGRWVAERTGGRVGPLCTAIGQERDGELIAGVMYDDFNGASISMHLRCDPPAHPSRKFWWMIFDYPFRQLGVKVIRSAVKESNTRSIHIIERLGGVRTAILPDHYKDGDGIIYSMYPSDCVCLKWR